MIHQKGFSLIEVLVALFLVSTVTLALLEQQCSNKLLLHRIHAYTQASNWADQSYEGFIAKSPSMPVPREMRLASRSY